MDDRERTEKTVIRSTWRQQLQPLLLRARARGVVRKEEGNANRMALLKQTAGNYSAEVTGSSNNQDHGKLKGI
jgi:hypothetical protein